MDLSASDPITKLPVVCLFVVLFLFKVKNKKIFKKGKPSKQNQIDPAYHFEPCFGTGHQVKFGLVGRDWVPSFIQSAASLFQELK